MNKTLLAICLAMASLSLSAQEVLDFSQPDPVSATPTRTTKLLRFAPNFRVYNTYFRGGFENSASLNVFNLEFRPWRNQHYFNAGLGVDYGSAYRGSRYYSTSGDVLSFDPVKETLWYCSRLKGSSWALLMTVSFMIFAGTTFPSKMGPTCRPFCAEAVHTDSIKAMIINNIRLIRQD